MKKKLLALVLACFMLVGLMPAALADGAVEIKVFYDGGEEPITDISIQEQQTNDKSYSYLVSDQQTALSATVTSGDEDIATAEAVRTSNMEFYGSITVHGKSVGNTTLTLKTESGDISKVLNVTVTAAPTWKIAVGDNDKYTDLAAAITAAKALDEGEKIVKITGMVPIDPVGDLAGVSIIGQGDNAGLYLNKDVKPTEGHVHDVITVKGGDVTLKDLTLDAKGKVNFPLRLMSGSAENITVENVTLTGGKRGGVNVLNKDAQNITLKNVTAAPGGEGAFYFDANGGGSGIKFENCTTTSGAGVDVLIRNAYGSSTDLDLSGITCTNNAFAIEERLGGIIEGTGKGQIGKISFTNPPKDNGGAPIQTTWAVNTVATSAGTEYRHYEFGADHSAATYYLDTTRYTGAALKLYYFGVDALSKATADKRVGETLHAIGDSGTSTVAPGATVEGDTAKTTVDENVVGDANIDKAKEDGTLTITATDSAAQSAEKSEVTLDKGVVKKIKDADVDVKIETPVGTITLSQEAVNTIAAKTAEGTGNDAVLKMEAVGTPTVTGAIKEFTVEVEVDGSPVDLKNLAPPITLTFSIGTGRTDSPVLVYKDETGALKPIENSSYDPNTGILTGTTSHLSTFPVLPGVTGTTADGGIGQKVTLTATAGHYLTVQVTHGNANAIFTLPPVTAAGPSATTGTAEFYVPNGSELKVWETDAAPTIDGSGIDTGTVIGTWTKTV